MGDALRGLGSCIACVGVSFLFSVIDFGDQESDRKKWVQCFSSADAIVFCAALSDYDSIDHDSGSSPRATSKVRPPSILTSGCWVQLAS